MSTRVILGQETNNSNTPKPDSSQIRVSGTNTQAVYYGQSEALYNELSQAHGKQFADSSPIAGQDNPMSTLRTATGEPIAGDMSKAADGSSITIGGMEMTVANGLQTGMLQKDAQGNISLSTDGEKFHQDRIQANTEAREQAIQTAEANRPTDVETADTMATLSQRGGVGVHASVAEAVQAMIKKDTGKYNRAVADIETAAGANGVKEFVDEYAQQSVDSLTANIGSSLGIDADLVYDFAVSEIPARELSQLIVSYGHGDLTVADYIQNQYMHKFQAWNSKRNNQ